MRLASLGALAGGLAHEIRNPLNAMSMNVQLLEEEITASGLAPGPALWATLATLANAVAFAALAMLASLHLPRIANFLLIFGAIALFAGLNLFSVSGAELSGTGLS